VDARLVVFERYRLHPEADWSLDRRGGFLRRQAAQWRALLRLLPQTDVFHFYFGLTLVPQSLQFPILAALRKKSVFHYLGSDIRGKRPSERSRPVILHAPSSRARKGTEHVVAACEGLDADLEIVEGLHHDEAFARFRAADIVVDQLNAGWYALFAMECMALGKPVVTFLHEQAGRRTEEAFGLPVPIVSATVDTLRERLRILVADEGERRRIGVASRAYVERVHDVEQIADRLLGLYSRLP
jgi:glycosyltransferase involved in cell wall biosynthesis